MRMIEQPLLNSVSMDDLKINWLDTLFSEDVQKFHFEWDVKSRARKSDDIAFKMQNQRKT